MPNVQRPETRLFWSNPRKSSAASRNRCLIRKLRRYGRKRVLSVIFVCRLSGINDSTVLFFVTRNVIELTSKFVETDLFTLRCPKFNRKDPGLFSRE